MKKIFKFFFRFLLLIEIVKMVRTLTVSIAVHGQFVLVFLRCCLVRCSRSLFLIVIRYLRTRLCGHNVQVFTILVTSVRKRGKAKRKIKVLKNMMKIKSRKGRIVDMFHSQLIQALGSIFSIPRSEPINADPVPKVFLGGPGLSQEGGICRLLYKKSLNLFLKCSFKKKYFSPRNKSQTDGSVLL